MILVTGATGTAGGAVARVLAEQGRPTRLLVRDPRRVTAPGPHAEVVTGTYADPATLDAALEGVRAVFVVTNNPWEPDDARLVEAAGARGVRHLVKLSAAAVEDELSEDLITCWQRRAEETIRTSGMDWTILRPRSFMTNTLAWASSIKAEGVVRGIGGDCPSACVDPRDVAEVAALALTGPGHAGRVHTLSGPEAVSAEEQVAQLGRALGRTLRYEELEPDQAHAQWLSRYPREIADALLTRVERLRDGAKQRVENTVPDELGRPARAYRDWVREHAARFD
ncbi:NAD(P)H-binding protein [Streptomyces sp. NPDC015346]|uniref:NAD(P)H-binding protein n=1 Tax=Streptomyces sp. NPDC015346 TaxID=3364954 RepID=UPI003702661C